MAQPIEIFGNVKGMTRDFGVDTMPDGYLWDLVDAIPSRKGARVEHRGPWSYFGTQDYGNVIWGGYYAAFTKGQKLLLVANGSVWDVNVATGAAATVGSAPSTMLQNGVKLRDRVYFMDGQGLVAPRVLTYDGATVSNAAVTTAPKGKVGLAYRDRLLLAGDPANPAEIYFSPLEIDGGPLATWDALSHIGSNNEVTGLAAMQGQVLVFHPAMIERIRGTVPPGTDLDTDMAVETLTDQVGCVQPQTIVPWRENIIFADERGVFITDGSTVRNLIELGGMGDFWRIAYGMRASGASVSCGTFLDFLMVSIITQIGAMEYTFTLVCDLNQRSWFRFRNFPATCYVPSESAQEEAFCGNWTTHRLMKTSTMFQDPVPGINPPPDYVDGNGEPVLSTLTTGFKRLSRDEGLKRIKNVHVSYHHESLVRALTANGVRVDYRTDPPTPEDLDLTTGENLGWTTAGYMPDVDTYTVKKLPIGKAGYGVMVRVTAATTARTHRVFNIGVESTAQDRGKVTV